MSGGEFALAPDGSCFITGDSNGLVSRRLDGTVLHEFDWGKYNIGSAWAPVVSKIAFSNDSRRLATASGEGWVFIWDVASGELIQLLRVNDEPVKDLAFSGSARRL